VTEETSTIFDASQPNIARIYDYYLGGKDNFSVDRQAAEKLLELHPPLREVLRGSRTFLANAVSWLAAQGVRQFLDIGSGLPTAQNTHEIAQAADPACRVVYVDNDPVVLTHARALLAGGNVAVARGDFREPEAITDNPDVRAVIDPDEPVALIIAMLAHFIDPDTVQRSTRALVDWMAPGSYLAISCASVEEGAVQGEMQRKYTASSTFNHPRATIESFFAGTELLPPGLADAVTWRPGAPSAGPTSKFVEIVAGVGRKP
jgi:S-adenosyl methyltransferase